MTPGEIVLAAVVALCFVAALVYRIYLTVRKKGGCDDCGGDCAHCGACRHAAQSKDKAIVADFNSETTPKDLPNK